MRLLLLCAGYGTRLTRDVDSNPTHSHLSGIPKPLLPVAGKPLISHWADEAKKHDIETTCIIVNMLYREKFERWRDAYPDVRVVCEGSKCNEDRSGAIACIWQAVDEDLGCEQPVLVVAGDTLLKQDFDLESFIGKFQERDKSALD
jgi:NDP-sugar pyrophosphorylase family protein